MTRQELVAMLGKPDATGGTTRKYPLPSVYLYDYIGFYFGPEKNGKLWLIFDESTHETIYKV